MNVQDIHLDIDKRVSPADVVRIGQGDAGGTTIRAHIFDNGVAADLTGMTARFEMRQPNTTNYVRDINCTVEGNVITYVVDEDTVASVAGTTDVAYFDILDGEDVIYSTERFSVDVLRSAHDGAEPAKSWDNAVDELIQRGEQAVSDAEQAVDDATSAIDAANQAIARIEPTIEQAAEDAAEQATADAEQRIQDAIDAVGDISELAVPLMSPDTRGGAKLEQHGGLALRDGALGIGSLVQESDGYARGGLAEVTAKGHAEQVATTGKNLLPCTLARVKSANANGTWSGNSYVVNGVTFTVNSDSNGCITSIVANGTPSATTECYLFAGLLGDIGSCYFSCSPSGGADSTYHCYWNYSDWSSYGDEYGNGCAVNLNKANVSITFRVAIASGYTCNNLTFFPQLELGSTATAYEPYTGAAPSPSPDYPQEIQVVRGRNMLDESKSVVGKLDVNGGIVESSTWARTSDYINVSGGSAYYFQNLVAFDKSEASVAWYSDSSFISSSIFYNSSPQSGSFVAPANATRARITYRFVDAGTVQLTLGSTPQSYVPYGHVGMEVQGKNLLDLSVAPILNAGTAVAENGKVTLTCTTAGTMRADYVVPLEIGAQYTVSGTFTNATAIVVINKARNANVVVINSSGGSATFTATEDACYLRVLKENAVVGNVVIAYPMLELGSTATEYEPYHHTTTPIPLPSRGWVAGLPDGTADTLTVDGAGKCEWELKDAEATYDGTEAFSLANVDTYQQIWTTGRVSDALSASRDINILVTHFGTYAGRAVNKAMLDNKNFNVHFAPNTFASVSDFKTWLSTHNVTVLYPLATPVTEDCGYVDDWPTDIPEGATVTIPELDEMGIRYFVDSAATELARQWYARANSEYADRLSALEQAVAELATS